MSYGAQPHRVPPPTPPFRNLADSRNRPTPAGILHETFIRGFNIVPPPYDLATRLSLLSDVEEGSGGSP